MNPLVWRGPEFLLLYAVVAMALLLWQWIRGQQREADVSAKASRRPNLNDPYELAFLRGGKNELLRVATVSLIEKKLLAVDLARKEPNVHTVHQGLADSTSNPVNAFLLHYYTTPKPAYQLLKATPTAHMTGLFDLYQRNLEKSGLLRNEDIRNGRASDTAVTVVCLLTLAGLKLAVAISGGHRNVGFLIMLAIAATIAACLIGFTGRLTTAGQKSVEDMRVLCESLQHKSGLSPMDVTMLAAVFGIAALPAVGRPYGPKLYPQASSSSSGCGSSSDSGGGGGGGCGGGGGGCGGCGS